MYELINKCINSSNLFSNNEVILFDMFTLYNNVLKYVGGSISEKVIKSGDIVNYTVGNEIPIIEVNLRYVYG